MENASFKGPVHTYSPIRIFGIAYGTTRRGGVGGWGRSTHLAGALSEPFRCDASPTPSPPPRRPLPTTSGYGSPPRCARRATTARACCCACSSAYSPRRSLTSRAPWWPPLTAAPVTSDSPRSPPWNLYAGQRATRQNLRTGVRCLVFGRASAHIHPPQLIPDFVSVVFSARGVGLPTS
jgi:hypothetical protein